ncbi:ABC transporter substrate-binding protein [Pseudotabrizicola alkalilacus]|uniref:Extracellular solute-binding protein n=1 Tax=Pseudotabrizicola alkalilacus TaxID=2305252 RepID=A0A411YXU2_9RHOB|nr:extracellular solute-binding protein [Pseudotabrizicola alkalilacus]RGP35563.1 extracellular solute-binding protein [Pseudotabrizicola alkalilacus]
MDRREALAGLALTALGLRSAQAQPAQSELRLLTSYDAEVIAPFVEEFSRRNPGITIRHLNKNTNAAVTELQTGNARRFDLFWASAPEAFSVLEAADRLDDRDFGPHVDFAYSAVGWAWQGHFAGSPPQTWNDLLDPAFAGQVVMSHPMRSGTTHSLIETILQDRGWAAGWAWLLELAGQLGTISARSFGVLEAVEQGDHRIGLTIDFLALKRASSGMVFRYGRPIIIIPARIAILKGAENQSAARAFVEFLLSAHGQRLLLRPDIRRIPVNPDLRAELSETLLPEVRSALHFSWSRYDPEVASQRYWQVNELFEAFIGRNFLRRRDLWTRWRALAIADPAQRQGIHRMLTHMPVTEADTRTAMSGRATLLDWQAQSQRLLDAAEVRLEAYEAQR